MLSVAAASCEGRRVTKAPRKTQKAPVKDVEFERREPPPASPDRSNDDVPLAVAGADDPAEPLDKVEQSGDFVWDEEESEELHRGRKEGELTLSVDSVRAYLKQIGKIALLNAEDEVRLATQIEAGLYAAERVHRVEDFTKKLSRSCAGTCAGSSGTANAPRTTCWRPTFAWSCRWPSATPAAAWRSWT